MSTQRALVGYIMGSDSDWPKVKAGAEILRKLGIPYEVKIVSAHRTPERLYEYAKSAKGRGLKVIIACAGGAAHLPGMTASLTPLPVLGVPVNSTSSNVNDMAALLSINQMPGGVPVATFAVGEAGAKNAALFAARMLAVEDDVLAQELANWIEAQTDSVAETPIESNT